MTMVDVFAPAKVNLTLHVTGQRADGYHLLDSLVMFADIGDRVSVTVAEDNRLTVDGPMAGDVPVDESNITMKAACLMDVPVHVELTKNLPHAAGLGGGSSDAAATLKALSEISGKPIPDNAVSLGADVPTCLSGSAARMQGIGDVVTPLSGLPVLHAVLVNPNLPVLTSEVFRRLKKRDNAPMPKDIPQGLDSNGLIDWLRDMRNDLEEAAIDAEPVVRQVFDTLSVTPGCKLTRMSGSGGTCFGLYSDAETAASAAGRLREGFPGWWVSAIRLNAPS